MPLTELVSEPPYLSETLGIVTGFGELGVDVGYLIFKRDVERGNDPVE